MGIECYIRADNLQYKKWMRTRVEFDERNLYKSTKKIWSKQKQVLFKIKLI